MKNGLLEFEWDRKKAATNLRKHRVSFAEAARVFSDVLAYTYADSARSKGEQRYITIGMSDQRRILVVAHVTRVELIRIVSARKATRRERREYEETSK
jgi:uncharacterized protein